MTKLKAEFIFCTAMEDGAAYWLNEDAVDDDGESTCSVKQTPEGYYGTAYVSVSWNQYGPQDDFRHDYKITVEDMRTRFSDFLKWAEENNYGNCAGRLMSDDYDAPDADVYFQWLAFGKIIYG